MVQKTNWQGAERQGLSQTSHRARAPRLHRSFDG
ncbi:hypothetical protein SBRY_40645 [Actinacidiphila bryophytorum]|uniref:Uncharacterized protein n=1 Tax=Actinacidiphila bryophytorum TaxID=1436133 RepID=A0A9W4H394_9ACTN|nr:hypothetical protein SBRY_40645 [Actinacidiphila bryophytorum]